MLLRRFQRGVGDVEFSREIDLSIGFVEETVEERGRLLMASWSARTSSSRTSESDRCESFGSRISMNLDGVSRIVNEWCAAATGEDRDKQIWSCLEEVTRVFV